MMIRGVQKKVLPVLGAVLLAGSSLLLGNESLWFSVDGGNVASTWKLGASLNQQFWPNGQYGSYLLWSDSWKLQGAYGTIAFRATAFNDITIGITKIDPFASTPDSNYYDQLTNSSNMYEIIIGGWDNSQSVIRRGIQTEPVKAESVGIPKKHDSSLGEDTPIEYRIIFYRDAQHNNDDTIAVFLRRPGDTLWRKILHYRDPSFITASMRWFSVTNWDRIIFYNNIGVSESTTLPPTA